jgi:aconitate hydratase
MGVLPLQFLEGDTRESLGLTGDEIFDLSGVPAAVAASAGNLIKVVAVSPDGKTTEFSVRARIDTPQEGEYYRNGGILPYVLRQLISSEAANG